MHFPKKPECLICNRRGLEALEAYVDVISERGIPCFMADDEVISILSDTITPQGVVAVSPLLHVEAATLVAGDSSLILVANRVRDPGNLGNMIRIADAAACDGVIVCRESADPYNPKTVRSTAGSIFHIPMALGGSIVETVSELKRAGFAIYLAHAHKGKDMWETEWPDRFALVMGNEAWGVPEEEESMADEVVRVPVFGKAESLNVSSATALLLYEARRRRLQNGKAGGNN
jgi:TrmH family RNA methyltransferase